ncbi:hypothetical protein D9613_007125 [Agrocybe pediades]|uniref:Uncharacterized protein n=1 Tax=Agrocybe pediades TaxID=84607 RepID=A0A8H4QH77_9AGAR|nr:hypothetical protein D9613_007125 [Agrocybe pediades]
MNKRALSSTTFPKNTITLGLTIRYPANDSDPDNYHWLIWIVSEDGVNGTCAHATNQTGAFQFEKKVESAGTSRNNLSALIQIGSLGKYSVDDVVPILEKIPMESPAGSEDENIKFSCRIWIREAARVLNKAGIITCSDVNALEKECEGYADANREATELGKGKPLFVVSKFSE